MGEGTWIFWEDCSYIVTAIILIIIISIIIILLLLVLHIYM